MNTAGKAVRGTEYRIKAGIDSEYKCMAGRETEYRVKDRKRD